MAMLKQYGTGMEVTTASGTQTVKAFFQPVRSRSVQNMVALATPLGEVGRGQYIYIGPPEVAVCDGDALKVGDAAYIFRRVEPFYWGEKPIYLWGLCVEKGWDGEWGKAF